MSDDFEAQRDAEEMREQKEHGGEHVARSDDPGVGNIYAKTIKGLYDLLDKKGIRYHTVAIDVVPEDGVSYIF